VEQKARNVCSETLTELLLKSLPSQCVRIHALHKPFLPLALYSASARYRVQRDVSGTIQQVVASEPSPSGSRGGYSNSCLIVGLCAKERWLCVYCAFVWFCHGYAQIITSFCSFMQNLSFPKVLFLRIFPHVRDYLLLLSSFTHLAKIYLRSKQRTFIENTFASQNFALKDIHRLEWVIFK